MKHAYIIGFDNNQSLMTISTSKGDLVINPDSIDKVEIRILDNSEEPDGNVYINMTQHDFVDLIKDFIGKHGYMKDDIEGDQGIEVKELEFMEAGVVADVPF